MNYKNCPKCNEANASEMRFCGKCGADMTTADELPPTVVGMSPPIMPPPNFPPNQPAQTPPNFQPPQQSNFQPPQQNFQQQSNFQQPPFQTNTPRSSSGKKIALIGGIVGLVVVIAGGIALWFAVIGPYFKEQARLKKEEENQTRANSTTAMSLLPEEFTTSTLLTFRKGKTIDKMQLLQASQNLPSELKSELRDINDAAAAEYINTTDSSRKVVLQIFKYDTPAQAVATCDKVGRELETKKASLKEVVYNPATLNRETNCHTSAADNNGGYTGISTLYGFLIIAIGQNDSKPGAGTYKIFEVLER